MRTCALLLLLFATCVASAAVSITTSAKTFQKDGGAASVIITGTGSWTATADTDWIVIKQGASGTDAGSCVYIVNANTTADTRIGHIKIGGNTYTITQYGYTATISPSSATFTRDGGGGTITVTVDAGVSWSAVANDSWITVSPASGTSVGTVSYTVSEYPGVVSRVGSITIGGKVFSVTQTGVDVNLEPKQVAKSSDADIISVTVTALAQTGWTVVPNDPWISVIDKSSGYGDYVLTLAINSNPSFARRTGTVSVGSAILTIVQEGLSTASLTISPETATASPSGAYGNVAVYATPDAPWTATSLTSWLTISEGAPGTGNGNIKYVASANPTVESRVGQILIQPPHKVVEPDLHRGLLFWIKDQKNIEGNELRQASVPLSTVLDGSKAITLSGQALPKTDTSSFAFAISFKVGELDCINRLFQLGTSARCFYLDANNVLHFDYATYSYTVDWTIPKANVWYTMVVSHCAGVNASGELKIYIGEKDKELSLVCQCNAGAFFKCTTESGLASSFKLGSTSLPSAGYLQSGQFANVRFWTRALTDLECEKVDVLGDAMTEDKVPAGAPSGVVWDYFPLDGNAYRTKSTSMTALAQNTALANWVNSEDRYGAPLSAISSTGNGLVTISGFHNMFGSDETDATYSFWIKVDSLPESGNAYLFRRVSSYSSWDARREKVLCSLSLTSKGVIQIGGEGVSETGFTADLAVTDWHQVSVVGRSKKSVQIYWDGSEIGNVSADWTLGRFQYAINPIDETLLIGGWNGAVDGLTIYHAALTSAQVREIYEQQKDKKVYHTVTQGIQTAKLSKSSVTVPAEGCSSSVALTVAQSVKWQAVANNDWIKITTDIEGAGSATVGFEVESNPAVTRRTGSITVAGVKMSIVQEPLWADVSCEDTSFDVESDSGVIWVETEGAGLWTASANVDWIHLFDEAGNGTAPVMFVVDDYSTTTESRSGVITIAGKKVVITQQGYELSIDPQVADLGSNAGAGQFGVAAPIDAVWEAIADCDWITIVGARTGIGDGTIQYTVTDNLTGETRVGRIVIGGKTYTITQRTTLPLTTQVVGKGSVTGAGNYNQGTKVTLKATAANGYVFSHWSGDAVGNDDSVEITVDIEKNVTATFIPEAAAQKLAEQKAAQGGFYTRDQIHALEMGNLVFDVDASGTARVGVQLMETSDLSDPNSWKPATLNGNPDVGQDGTVGMKVKAEGNAKFFKVVMPEQQ